MASQTSSGELISNRYASALFELANHTQSVDKILNDLNLIQDCLNQNKDLKLLIRSPLISSSDKLNIMEKILSKNSVNKLTSNFLKVISVNKRFANLLSIISNFKKINLEKRGDIIVDINSADSLSNDQKTEISNKLKSILGEKLSLNFNVDKKIIAGLIFKVGSKMIDSSLASKITKLKIAMKGA
tara:strand:- start:988 stop:1545 length:558 start_codon:yes stop_codon:yes gene_type:complete